MIEKVGENRNRKVTIRLTQSEYKKFSQEATNSNMSISQFIVESCKGTRITTVSNAAQFIPPLCRIDTALNKLEYEYDNKYLQEIGRELKFIWQFLK